MERKRVTSVVITEPATFGKYLITRRRERNLSRRVLSREATISDDTLVQLETATPRAYPVSLWLLVGIADALDVKVQELLDVAVDQSTRLNIVTSDIMKARDTVIGRRMRMLSSVKAPETIEMSQPPNPFVPNYAAITPSVDKTEPRSDVPSVLELMQRVRGLDDECRLLVSTFIASLG